MSIYPKVLLLDGNPDGALLEKMLEGRAAVTRVETIPEALALARRTDYDAIFCPWELADGTWQHVLQEVQRRRLEIPVIVFCHYGGEREWSEVLKAGAFDLLAPPYDGYELGALLAHALACRHPAPGCLVA